MEQLDDNLPELANQIADELLRTKHEDLTLFGHSMGSIIAWWVGSKLLEKNHLQCRLVLSAQSPKIPLDWLRSWCTGGLSQWYKTLGEPWPETLDNDEMREILISTLDQDIAWMLREFRCPLPNPLPFEVHGICWESDQIATNLEMKAWKSMTSGHYMHHTLQGGHLEICNRPEPAQAILQQIITGEIYND